MPLLSHPPHIRVKCAYSVNCDPSVAALSIWVHRAVNMHDRPHPTLIIDQSCASAYGIFCFAWVQSIDLTRYWSTMTFNRSTLFLEAIWFLSSSTNCFRWPRGRLVTSLSFLSVDSFHTYIASVIRFLSRQIWFMMWALHALSLGPYDICVVGQI